MMKNASLMITVCATLLCAATALATPTPQQSCDYARITAWKVYTSCLDAVLAKDAKGVTFDGEQAFAKCRHAYFKKWVAFQGKAKYATSSCDQTVPAIGGRFKDNGDQTVTDNLTGLVWELKSNSGMHNVTDSYTWSTGSSSEDGTAFSAFLTTDLNTPGFAGANGWRLPTVEELQTIVLDFACTGAWNGPTCTCGSAPCIDATFGLTQSSNYWSATSDAPNPIFAWTVRFDIGLVAEVDETTPVYVRAVRGGL